MGRRGEGECGGGGEDTGDQIISLLNLAALHSVHRDGQNDVVYAQSLAQQKFCLWWSSRRREMDRRRGREGGAEGGGGRAAGEEEIYILGITAPFPMPPGPGPTVIREKLADSFPFALVTLTRNSVLKADCSSKSYGGEGLVRSPELYRARAHHTKALLGKEVSDSPVFILFSSPYPPSPLLPSVFPPSLFPSNQVFFQEEETQVRLCFWLLL